MLPGWAVFYAKRETATPAIPHSLRTPLSLRVLVNTSLLVSTCSLPGSPQESGMSPQQPRLRMLPLKSLPLILRLLSVCQLVPPWYHNNNDSLLSHGTHYELDTVLSTVHGLPSL